jgi:hypothetical protein
MKANLERHLAEARARGDHARHISAAAPSTPTAALSYAQTVARQMETFARSAEMQSTMRYAAEAATQFSALVASPEIQAVMQRVAELKRQFDKFRPSPAIETWLKHVAATADRYGPVK